MSGPVVVRFGGQAGLPGLLRWFRSLPESRRYDAVIRISYVKVYVIIKQVTFICHYNSGVMKVGIGSTINVSFNPIAYCRRFSF